MKNKKKDYLLYKGDIPELLNCRSMSMVYKLILTEEIIKELGFESMKKFKNIKVFNLNQSRRLKQFFTTLLTEENGKD